MFIAMLQFGFQDSNPVPYIVNNEAYVNAAQEYDFLSQFYVELEKVKSKKKKTWRASDVIEAMKKSGWDMLRVNNSVYITL
jgi:hypothetical protein